MQRMLVDQTVITRAQVVDAAPAELEDGQARLALESFALTANNVTYAATGFDIGYWQFFPSGVDGQGIVPVWGVAQVTQSRAGDLAVGTRLYGFYPVADELVISPKADGQGSIVDEAPHRTALPAIYNRYTPVQGGKPEQDHLRALLQPLLATSWLLFDWLQNNACFGAEQIIIGSASSKTGLGLCKFLAEPETRNYRIVGLTSQSNRSFVEGLGACDQVLSYDEVAELSRMPSVYIDLAGNGKVKLALHVVLAEHLKYSAAVGISHWDKFTPKQDLPGVKPQFFFAPSQVAKRREDWGPGVVEQKIAAAWKRIASDATDWLEIQVHQGVSAAPAVFAELAEGRADPRQGHIITL